jgi:hypothetical protein
MMTSQPNPSKARAWSADERAWVDALIDALLPPSADGRLPAASKLGIADVLALQMVELAGFGPQLALCLDTLAELASARNAALAELDPAARTELVQALAVAEPETFAAVQRQAFIAYYTHADVPELFGFPNRPPQPLGHKQPPDELETLLTPVRARGRCYRDA